MKKLLITALAIFGLNSMLAQTQEEMMAWQAYMTPGDAHQWLATLDGNWDAEVKMWMDPAAPPTISKATTTNKMIMGGRYQQSIHKGDMGGMPFEGQSITAFDNAKKKYIATWIDNMGTGVLILEGDYNKETKQLIMTGTMVDPMTGKDIQVKEVMTYLSKDKHKFEMFMIQEGQELKTMEIVYTRKK
ncbi:DUF1579 domain-containing protein [Mesonia sp. K7]|uniref:DUF1579 domain-containing protein n=1 Tax=Mesonia sp. K7 TaxID=2218606 RepID=UPI000DAA6EFD|nr:DUF1579 domain-containing protein [Mesonia sp. K7]PZD79302.1 hypothetical protein DNG35_02115 [Mesonia sp. K7]